MKIFIPNLIFAYLGHNVWPDVFQLNGILIR